MKLRSYQEKGTTQIRMAYSQGFRWPIYILPTGGGKTVVFCYIASKALAMGNSVWILVHRVELLKQTSAALTLFGVPHAVVAPRRAMDPHSKIQVAMVQTIAKRMHRMLPPKLVIIDECHHTNASTWRDVLAAVPLALRLGVTATPIRQDGRGLGDMFDVMILGPTMRELIDEGYLVPPRIFCPWVPDMGDVKVRRGDFLESEVAAIIDKPSVTGGAVEHYAKICPGQPAVAFCVNVKHAEHVAQAFRDAGYLAEAVDGKTDPAERARILAGLGDGTVQVVASCNIISEGTDIPAIHCAIFLRPTQSEGLYMQMAGRPLRPVYAPGFDLDTLEGRMAAIAANGKTHAIILDHAGNFFRHGRPDADRPWELFPSSEKRKRTKVVDEYKPLVCAHCYGVFDPAPLCPYCGKPVEKKKSQMTQKEGELVEIPEELSVNGEAISKRARIARARTMEELLHLQKVFEYKDGWADYVFNARLRSAKIKSPDLNA